MFKNCRNLFFFAIVYFLESNLISREPDVLSQFVENHLLIVESKMKDSPTLWLDVREGYLRNKTVYLSEVVMDSLDEEFIASLPMQLRLSREMEDQYSTILYKFPQLRQKISELEEEMKEKEAEFQNFRINYDRLQKINTDYLRQIIELQGLK